LLPNNPAETPDHTIYAESNYAPPAKTGRFIGGGGGGGFFARDGGGGGGAFLKIPEPFIELPPWSNPLPYEGVGEDRSP